jgi:transcriptional regulator with GAF, ATPase, and Fis domain
VVADDGASVKLLDLGLAHVPVAGEAARGTPGFMAPELWRGESGPRADLYALGVTLHALLTDAPGAPTLAPGEHLAQALRPVAERAPLPPWVDPGLVRLIAALQAPEPEARPASAHELVGRVQALRLALGLGDGGAVGGGADDVPSDRERALRVQALPFTGNRVALERLRARLAEGGVCVVRGAAGSGRSRLVREAVRALQEQQVASAAPAPTYLCTALLPRQPIEHDAVLQLRVDWRPDPSGREPELDVAQLVALLTAARIEGRRLALVLEPAASASTEALDAALRDAGFEPCAVVDVEPLGEAELQALWSAALPGVEAQAAVLRVLRELSGGLAGRACLLLAQALASGRDPARAAALRESAAELGSDELSVPEVANELADLMALAGGTLDATVALACLAEPDALAVAGAALVSTGCAQPASDGRLRLSGGLTGRLRAALSPARVRSLAAQLKRARVAGRELGFVQCASGEAEAALASFGPVLTRLRAEGDPEGAARLAAEARQQLPAAQAERLIAGEADALRAAGRYRAALELLATARDPATRVASAELARLAGDRARASALVRELLAELAPEAAQAAELQVTRARLAFDAGELPAAAREASEVMAREPRSAAGLRAVELLALCELYGGDPAAAAERARHGAELARALGQPAAEARLCAVQGLAARAAGDTHLASNLGARAFELADRAGEYHAAASFLANLGAERLDAGDPGGAIRALRDGARRLARLGRDADLGRVLYNLAYAAHLIGDDDLGDSAARQALESATRAADPSAQAYATTLLGEVARRRGDRRAVAQRLQQGAAPERLGPADRVVVAARRGSLWLGLGEAKRAAEQLGLARAAADEAPGDVAQIECELLESQLALERGELPVARSAADRALAAAQRSGAFDARLRCALLAARTAQLMGDDALAAVRLSDVRSLLDAAAQGLEPADRARLRAVDAYRVALEATPTRGPEPRGAGDERWRTLATLSKRLNAERREARLHEAILDAAVQLSGAERGYLVLRDGQGRARVRAGRGLLRDALDAAEVALSRSIVDRVLGSGRALSTVDAAHDDRLSGAASVAALALRSVAAVPLSLRGEVVGALYLEDRLRPFAFGATELELLTDLAEIASIALDSVRALKTERRAARRLGVLRLRLARQVELQALELDTLRRDVGTRTEQYGIVAHSPAMQEVLALMTRVARAEIPVLLSGESGTGKELVARAIHAASPRATAAFISENCSAIPETLLESALFGHERGAFTGAEKRRVGLFEAADGGTLFLDEIGEMSPAMQSRLLRVLQDGEIRPVGSERVLRVDARVVAATHRDLEAMVKDGSFREDLYYRLAVVKIRLPALRERPEDVAPLVAHFLERHGQGRKLSVERRALAALAAHAWPGNVRQLENELRRALVLADDVIREEHLSQAVVGDEPGLPDELDLKSQLERLERRLIRQALQGCAGNQTRAAKRLGVSRFGLQKMMKRLQLG